MRVFSELTVDEWSRIALWGGVTILSIVAFVVVVFIMRRRLHGQDDSQSSIFDLEDLQKMRDRGDIDEAEYKALRTQAIAAMMVESDGKP
ncbi:MAG: hypothetical protein DHS20C16_14640 [Phycisphaerae bacterium]|nr:MAG: hypothetical protein DHS20C16_14640 [Phycisphaerae bacterium]